MSELAIRVEDLGKRYRIGPGGQPRRLREAVAEILHAPLRLLRRKSSSSRAGAPAPGRSGQTIWALRDVSFDVREGELVGVIGGNGSGKSTLLKILSRITSPTTGYAEIRGRVSSLLEVGTGFHPELTGRENVYLNGAVLGIRKAEVERKFDDIVAFAGVERFIDTPVKYYSSGMYLRLAFAVAAHMEPEILLIDEVLAVGDAAFQERCLAKMAHMAKEGRALLFVTHNLGALQQLCPRTLVLAGGEKVCDTDSPTAVATYLRSLEPAR